MNRPLERTMLGTVRELTTEDDVMRPSAPCIRILILAGLLMTGPMTSGVAAVSVEDLVNLKANGLGDDVLIALIQADKSTFQLTADEIVQLRQRGLGDRVIVAMLNTAPMRPPQAPAADAMAPSTSPTTSPSPVNQNVITQQVTVSSTPPPLAYAVPVFMPVPVSVAPVALPPPVYWGFGGRPRGDAWRSLPAQPPPTAPPAQPSPVR